MRVRTPRPASQATRAKLVGNTKSLNTGSSQVDTTTVIPTRMTSGAATAARPDVWAPIDQHANSTANSGSWSGSTSVSATFAKIHRPRIVAPVRTGRVRRKASIV